MFLLIAGEADTLKLFETLTPILSNAGKVKQCLTDASSPAAYIQFENRYVFVSHTYGSVWPLCMYMVVLHCNLLKEDVRVSQLISRYWQETETNRRYEFRSY